MSNSNARRILATLVLGSLLGLTVALLSACGGGGGGGTKPPPTPVNQVPVASFTAAPSSGAAPLVVAFDATASTDPDGSIVTYAWDFGDGTAGTGRTVSHTFATVGSYTARLTVTDNAGATATATQAISVTSQPPPLNQPPVAAFTATPTSGLAPLVVSFDAGASADPDGTITTYAWSFGDTTTGTGRTTAHTYSAVGTYTASLTVTDNAGATASSTTEIRALAPSSQWLGLYKSSLIPEVALYAETAQNGTSLDTGTTFSGTYQDKAGRVGTLTGAVTPSAVTMTFSETTPGCTGTFNGTGTVASILGAEAIEFSFTGTDCLGSHVNGVGQLIRQSGYVLAWGQNQPTSLTYSNGELFWTESSREPLKKIVLATGETKVLANRMRALTTMTVEPDRLLWTDAIGDRNAYCTGLGVQQALLVSATDGSNVQTLAEGPACSGAIAPAADGTYAYWVTNRSGTDAWRIERVPLAGGASSVIYTASGFNSITALAHDDRHLYWIEENSVDAGYVRRCTFASCGQVTETIFSAPTIDMATNLAITTDRVVFGARRYGPPSDRIISVPKSGGAAIDIAMASDFPRTIVTDGAAAYWIDSTSVHAVPLAGGTVTTLASGLAPSFGLSVDGQRVAWTERPNTTTPFSGRVRAVPKAGGAIETLVANAASPLVVQLAGNGELLYADGVIDYLPGSTSGIYRRTQTGSIVGVVGGIAGARSIAVNANHVLVAEGWWIKRVPRNGGTPLPVTQASFDIASLDVDAAYVYFVESDLGAVKRAPIAGGVPAFLGTGSGMPFDLRVRNGQVYWLLGLDKLLRVPVTGGTVETVASGLRAAEALTVDDGFAYFTESDAGRVSKVATAGGPVTPIGGVAGFQLWYALTHDTGSVYWLTPMSVGSIAKDGSTERTIAPAPLSSEFTRGSVAVDDTYVYWAETLIGAIKRAPK